VVKPSQILASALITLSMLAVAPAVASAELYVWHDRSGNLVLSDRPKGAAARTYSVTPASTVRVTRPLSRRAALYQDLVDQHAAANGVRPELVRAVIQAESAFNPNARSVKGAMGLMQLMPATAEQYNVANAFDPGENIRAGVAYLRALLTRYDGKEELALAAYNAGPGAVAKYGGVVPPYRETREYVERIRGSLARPEVSDSPAPASPALAAFHLYRSVELRNGREVVKYSNVPTRGAEVVAPAAPR
jgi:soluble lytic murein transglycosylase-like protein